MFLKHGVGCFFSFFRWIQLSRFLYSLDSTCGSSFLYFCCCYVALFAAVQLHDVEVFDRFLCPSEFLCI